MNNIAPVVHADPELLAYWRTMPAPSNERLAVDIIETLQRENRVLVQGRDFQSARIDAIVKEEAAAQKALRDENKKLRVERDSLAAFKRGVEEALNSGDGSYRP